MQREAKNKPCFPTKSGAATEDDFACEHGDDIVTLLDRYPALRRVVQAWRTLPIHLRESILNLVDAAALLSLEQGEQP